MAFGKLNGITKDYGDYFLKNQALPASDSVVSVLVAHLRGTLGGIAVHVRFKDAVTTTADVTISVLGDDSEDGSFADERVVAVIPAGAIEAEQLVAVQIPDSLSKRFGKLKITTGEDLSGVAVDAYINRVH